jgi:hypothetical protein
MKSGTAIRGAEPPSLLIVVESSVGCCGGEVGCWAWGYAARTPIAIAAVMMDLVIGIGN